MIDENIQNELRNRFNPDGSILRKAQLRMLELLKFLDKLCSENDLKYWLDSGTLLGAVRHGGFIPWDDDVDVCMMKEDADKLKKIMSNRIWNNHIVLQTHETDTNYYNVSWMTLRDTKSEYVTKDYSHNLLKYRGLQVDIFVLDSNVHPLLLKATRLMYIGLIYAPLWNWLGLRILRPLVSANYNLLTKIVFPSLNKIKKTTDMISSGLGAQYLNSHKVSSVFPLRQITFEGHKFLCPLHPDEYLHSLYGNWKQIPTPDKIQTHNVSFKFEE